MSVLGLITSFPPYLRSAMVRFPLVLTGNKLKSTYYNVSYSKAKKKEHSEILCLT